MLAREGGKAGPARARRRCRSAWVSTLARSGISSSSACRAAAGVRRSAEQVPAAMLPATGQRRTSAPLRREIGMNGRDAGRRVGARQRSTFSPGPRVAELTLAGVAARISEGGEVSIVCSYRFVAGLAATGVDREAYTAPKPDNDRRRGRASEPERAPCQSRLLRSETRHRTGPHRQRGCAPVAAGPCSASAIVSARTRVVSTAGTWRSRPRPVPATDRPQPWGRRGDRSAIPPTPCDRCNRGGRPCWSGSPGPSGS